MQKIAGFLFFVVALSVTIVAAIYLLLTIFKHGDTLGPRPLWLQAGQALISEKDLVVSFEGNTYFEIKSSDTGEITVPEIIPATVGETETNFKITDLRVVGGVEYQVLHSGANVFSSQRTVVTVENNCTNIITSTIVGVIAFCILLECIMKITIALIST